MTWFLHLAHCRHLSSVCQKLFSPASSVLILMMCLPPATTNLVYSSAFYSPAEKVILGAQRYIPWTFPGQFRVLVLVASKPDRKVCADLWVFHLLFSKVPAQLLENVPYRNRMAVIITWLPLILAWPKLRVFSYVFYLGPINQSSYERISRRTVFVVSNILQNQKRIKVPTVSSDFAFANNCFSVICQSYSHLLRVLI